MSAIQIARTIGEVRAKVAGARHGGRTVGFVPTMGALHRGHISLIDAARAADDFVVVSIFVNPTQFAPHEDFAQYPRDEARDLELCAQAEAALAFLPGVAEMYRTSSATTVHVGGLADTLCGPHRPGHFDGVATVVAKLFNIVQPDRAYFGEKDAQQLAIIRRMVRDLDLPVEVVGCPTVREPDGLAMSSRNAYLSAAERAQAACLYQALRRARERIMAGERRAAAVADEMRSLIQAAGPAQIDYVSLVDPEALTSIPEIAGPVLVALAVRIGKTRLIDNLRVDPHAVSP